MYVNGHLCVFVCDRVCARVYYSSQQPCELACMHAYVIMFAYDRSKKVHTFLFRTHGFAQYLTEGHMNSYS